MRTNDNGVDRDMTADEIAEYEAFVALLADQSEE